MAAGTVAILLFFSPAASAALEWDARSLSKVNASTEGQIEFVFHCHNIGKYPVAIKSVEVSCGCTSAKASSNLILPKETESITAMVIPNSSGGRRTANIAVETSLGTDTLTVTLDRLQYVQFAPRLIYWKSGGPTVSQTITLKVSGKLLGVRVLDPGPDRVVINVPTTVHKQTYSIPITIGNTLLPQVTRLIASAVGPDGRIIEATAYALVLDDSVSTVSKRAINIEQPK